ncbi:MAG: hypothetical protein IVW36_07450 [Dehalococcoidia bacterium]|nr:hypothetical protein [Dehalococcoidia bacterium]
MGALVELTEHSSLSRETVRRRLDQNELKPWRKDQRARLRLRRDASRPAERADDVRCVATRELRRGVESALLTDSGASTNV